MTRKISWILGTMTLLLLGVASFTLYNIISQASEETLLKFGISNFYYQSFITLGLVLIIFFVLGWSIKKTIGKVVRG